MLLHTVHHALCAVLPHRYEGEHKDGKRHGCGVLIDLFRDGGPLQGMQRQMGGWEAMDMGGGKGMDKQTIVRCKWKVIGRLEGM